MYVKKGSEFLLNFSLEQIEKKCNEEKNAKAKIRLQCALLRKKGKSQPKKLSAIQRTKLKRIVSKSPRKSGLPYVIWTTKLVQYIIQKEFKVDYVAMQVHRLLKSMKITLQKARPEHIKANKKLQAQFKKNFGEESKFLGSLDMRSYFWTRAHLSSSRT